MMEILERPRAVLEHQPEANHNDTLERDRMAAEQSTQNTHERWLPVPGYEGYYEVSSEGRVRSLDRFVDHASRWGGTYRGFCRGKVLSTSPTDQRRGDFHQKIGLCRDGKRSGQLVHRLVMLAFVGPCPDGMEVCHNNGDPTDNRLSNLRYDTRAENMLDIVRSGEHHHARKTHCPQGHAYIPENLVPAGLKHGYRACLSCNRARRKISKNPALKSQFLDIANENFRMLSGGSAA